MESNIKWFCWLMGMHSQNQKKFRRKLQLAAIKQKVIDEMLTVPSVQKKKMSSCHVSGIPRCISSKKFQDIMKKKEQEKKELEDAKEEHKRKHIANAEEKKRHQEEAKKKQEEKEKTKIKKAKATVMAVLAALRPKCE